MTEQMLIEKIRQLPPDKAHEVEDFVDFLMSRMEAQQDAEDVEEVLHRQASANASERRTLDDLRQAWRQ